MKMNKEQANAVTLIGNASKAYAEAYAKYEEAVIQGLVVLGEQKVTEFGEEGVEFVTEDNAMGPVSVIVSGIKVGKSDKVFLKMQILGVDKEEKWQDRDEVVPCLSLCDIEQHIWWEPNNKKNINK